MTKVKGINPKRWFYGFRTHLRDNKDHVRRVMAGSACEQWLNAEFGAWLAADLVGSEFTVRPELGKHDLAVLRVGAGEGQLEPVVVIESKVLYPNYAPAKLQSLSDRLCHQVVAPVRLSSEPVARIGVLWGVLLWYPDADQEEQLRASSTRYLRAFRQSVGEIDQRTWKVQLDHDRMETVLPAKKTAIGAVSLFSGCVARWFQVRTLR